jgi:hypothetical protein
VNGKWKEKDIPVSNEICPSTRAIGSVLALSACTGVGVSEEA